MSKILSSPVSVNYIIGYMRIVDFSINFLVNKLAQRFITDFEYEDFLYFPSKI